MELNPWSVEDLDEFLFYCCPECDEKCVSKETFLNHALELHPHAGQCLNKFQWESTKCEIEPDFLDIEIKEEVSEISQDTEEHNGLYSMFLSFNYGLF